MPDEKKLCPLQKTTKRQYSANGNVEYEYVGTCTGERCAWWVIDRCAIPQIALNGMENLAEKSDKEICEYCDFGLCYFESNCANKVPGQGYMRCGKVVTKNDT